MRSFKRTAVVVVALLVFFGVIIFILENQQPASLTFWLAHRSVASFFVFCRSAAGRVDDWSALGLLGLLAQICRAETQIADCLTLPI